MKRIPIKTAREISKNSGYPEIVIFAYDPITGRQHMTTYGKNHAQCVDAARTGNFLKKILNWPDKLCHAKPRRATEEEKAMLDDEKRIEEYKKYLIRQGF
jgi:hypothetical protein